MNTTELNEAPVYAWSAQRELALLEAGYLTVKTIRALGMTSILPPPSRQPNSGRLPRHF